MEKRSHLFDVCIVCALPEEVRAFIEIVREQSGDTIKERSSPRYNDSYHYTTLKNNKGEHLNLHISYPPRYGSQEMTLHLSHVLEECQPRIAIMTGICAGDAKRVLLGDLVVAERTFTYDNGKFTTDDDGRRVYAYDTLTYQLDPKILQFLALFDKWKPLVADLKRPLSPSEHNKEQELQEEREITCYLKPMASGSAVRADNPFEDVQAPVRETVAIDMEGAAFGLVMSHYPSIPWLVVKGVCDYADRTKNDAYHDYAAHASALYALSFIQDYVTNERLCRSSGPLPTKRTGASEDQNVSYPHTRKPDFIKWRKSIFFVALPLIILLGVGGIFFLIHNTTDSLGSNTFQAQQVLNQFCTDLEKGQYQDINDLIAPITLNHNGGAKNLPNAWAAMQVKTCQPGTVHEEVPAHVFTGIITYYRISPSSPQYKYQITIENIQDSWKITDWGTA